MIELIEIAVLLAVLSGVAIGILLQWRWQNWQSKSLERIEGIAAASLGS